MAASTSNRPQDSGQEHPRLLIYSPGVFNSQTGTGVFLANLFKGWPKARLAIIHWDPTQPDTDVCERAYRLGPAEIDKQAPWSWFLAPTLAVGEGAKADGAVAASRYGWIKSLLGEEAPHRAILTPQLMRWIEDFKPQAVYTLLGTLPYMRLFDAIMQRFELPYAVHIMDDWPSVCYRKGVLGPFMRHEALHRLDRALARAKTRLVICDAMREAFTRRYGHAFTAYQNMLEAEAWQSQRKTDYRVGEEFHLLYAGSILVDSQFESLKDAVQAVVMLNKRGVRVRLAIHAPRAHAARYRSRLEILPHVSMGEPLGNEGIASSLAAADALLLPVNFDDATRRYVRYSMPAKIPAYLFSAAPVLAYGPGDVASIRYAREGGWAYVQSNRDIHALVEAIGLLIRDEGLRRRLGERAFATGVKNHDARVLRPAFHAQLCALTALASEK